jgi:1,2-phenylacetyl-CoA epoxidase PaaB subunit
VYLEECERESERSEWEETMSQEKHKNLWFFNYLKGEIYKIKKKKRKKKNYFIVNESPIPSKFIIIIIIDI